MFSRPKSLRPKSLRFPPVSAPGWLAWLLPVFAWAPLAYPGYFEFQSGFAPIFNLTDLAQRLGDPAWAPSAGQAYDLLRGELSLPYLLALLPRALGAPSVLAIKLVFGAALLAAAAGMFGWARRRLGPWPALLAAFVYVLWPMGLATIYERGALAEALLLGLMPLALWAADSASPAQNKLSVRPLTPNPVASGRRRRAMPALALGLMLAATLWTQAGLALWFAAVLLAYLLLAGRARVLGPAFWGWLGGLAAGLAGLLPLLFSRGLGGSAWPRFESHYVQLSRLLLGPSSAAPTAAGAASDTAAYPLGLVACALALLGVMLWAQPDAPRPGLAGHESASAERSAAGRLVRFAVALLLVLLFLSTALAAPAWRLLPFLARTLTYPWQLLLLAGPWLAWLAGLAGRLLFVSMPAASRSPGQVPLFSALLGLALLGSYGTLNPPSTSAAVPDQPVAIFGDHQIALLSIETSGLPTPGRVISATVRWQALRPLDRDYTVFLQALGPDDQVWGQQDTMPRGGELPTTRWQPGVVVSDQYQLTLKTGAPAGPYRALFGFYDWQTGERLRTATDDKLVLDH